MSARLTLRPDRWAAGGDAIARDPDGRIVFVHGAIAGETVVADVVQTKRDFRRAVVVDVVDAAPGRVEPPCWSRRRGCGGCGWMHLTHDAQGAAKVHVVADALRRIGRLEAPVVERGGSVAPFRYRTTVRVAATPDGRAGYRAEQSHDVVEAPDCLIAHARLAEVLPRLDLDPDVEVTVRVSAATGELTAVWDGSRGDVRGLPDTTAIGRDASLEEVVGGRRFTVSAASFFQSGPQAAELLVDAVRRGAPELAGAAVVVDAYAGVGILAACAADPASRLIVIETSRSAVADARRNLADRRAEVVKREVGGWHAPPAGTVDVVLADPARSGLGSPGTNALARAGAPVVVLVSCDPASLGRDARLLADAGYRHERSELVDTFPQTTHIEVVSRFVRR